MSHSIKRRILIIDDQESIHQDYRKIITPLATEHAGLAQAEAELFGNVVPERELAELDLYEIDSAFQGEDAVGLVQQALAEGRPYAVAFVDIRMPPGCDGIQTIRKMWEFDRELLVVISSAYSDYGWEDICRALGRTDRFLILRKPFESIEVRQFAAALSQRWVIARTDPLTGLLNRRAFKEQLRHEWTHCVRHQQPLCCAMLDLDYFKAVNDRFGHATGDQMLKTICEMIQANMGPDDVVCRYGGEEFCILMPNTEEEGFRRVESLRQQIAQQQIAVEQTSLRITASFGVSAADGATLGQQELIDQADAAMRQSKRAGRDRVTRWSEYGSAAPDAKRMRQYSALFESIPARQIMTSYVPCMPEHLSVGNAAEMLVEYGLSSIPVVNQNGELTGMISERDLLDALGTESGWFKSISELMTTPVLQYDPQTSAQVVFDFLCRVQLRRVVIVEDGKPVGIISRGSFLRFIGNYLKSSDSPSPAVDSRQHLFKATDSLMSRLAQLKDDLRADPSELLAPVVCGVSSIEMLLGDLLMWAGSAKQNLRGEKFAECV